MDGTSLDSALTVEDKERLLQMLVQYGDLNADHLYKGTKRGGYRGGRLNAGLKAGELDDPLDFSDLLKSDFWEYKLHFDDFLDQNPTLLQPVGGMDTIAKAFEERVGSFVRYRSVVEEIRKSPKGVRIVYPVRIGRRSRPLWDADFAICSIPAPVLKDIQNDFAPETKAAIKSVAFAPAIKIAFQTRRRFWEEDHAIYGGISWTDQDITQIWYPPYGYHRDNGVIVGAYVWNKDIGLRFEGMSPEERLRVAIEEGERVHPGYAGEIEAGVSRAWGKVPFQKGAWPTGKEAPAALQRPDGAIYFAGDQASALPGWQEGSGPWQPMPRSQRSTNVLWGNKRMSRASIDHQVGGGGLIGQHYLKARDGHPARRIDAEPDAFRDVLRQQPVGVAQTLLDQFLITMEAALDELSQHQARLDG